MRSMLTRTLVRSASTLSSRRIERLLKPARLSTVAAAQEKRLSRPQWVQAFFHDKRSYFENVKDVEKCFLTGVKLDDLNQMFVFNFDDAPMTHFRKVETSYLALRENCPCPSCFDYNPQMRKHSMIDLDLEERPRKMWFDADRQQLRVIWNSDGHESVYSGPWLYATYTPHPLFQYPKRVLWDAKQYSKNIQQFDYAQICDKPQEMLRCLTGLAKYGFIVIRDAPARLGVLAELSQHMNYVKRTHYGDYFEVRSKEDWSNPAYTSAKITQHTDLPYFGYMPQIQFLHCINQAPMKGGENGFADGFAVAEWMRRHKRHMFELLTRTKMYCVNFTSDVSDAFLSNKLPPITLNSDGSIKHVIHSNLTFDSLRHLSAAHQREFIKAYRFYMEMLESPELRFMIKMVPGDISIFDNTRVTHGREAFDAGGPRLLEGCYMDWDELFSRMRLIRSKIFREKLAARYPKDD